MELLTVLALLCPTRTDTSTDYIQKMKAVCIVEYMECFDKKHPKIHKFRDGALIECIEERARK